MGFGLIQIEDYLRIRSKWNCLVRMQTPEWFRKFRIGSDWIAIRNFRQDKQLQNLLISTTTYEVS